MGRWLEEKTGNSFLRAGGRIPARAAVGSIIALGLVCLATGAFAQTPSAADLAPATGQNPAQAPPKLLPESGTLTGEDYRNPYYEFAFEFPAIASSGNVERRFMHTDLMSPGAHALLSVLFRNGEISTEIGIQSWDESSGHTLDAVKAAKEEASEIQRHGRIVTRGPREVRAAKGVTMLYLEEWSFRADRSVHVLFLVRKQHLIRIVAVTNDAQTEAFGKWFIKAIRFEDFAAPPGAQAYNGPTVPTSLVDDALTGKAGLKLPSDAKVEGDSWVSAALGLRYRLPKGWKPRSAATPDLFVRYHPLLLEGTIPQREQELLRACSRPLLEATASANRAPGTPSSEEPPSLTILAADATCLALPFPEVGDETSIGEFVSALALFQDFGEVRTTNYLIVAGRLFFDVRGLVSYRLSGSRFTNRRAQAVYLTERPVAGGGRQVLFWFFTAAHESEIPGFSKIGVEFLNEK